MKRVKTQKIVETPPYEGNSFRNNSRDSKVIFNMSQQQKSNTESALLEANEQQVDPIEIVDMRADESALDNRPLSVISSQDARNQSSTASLEKTVTVSSDDESIEF